MTNIIKKKVSACTQTYFKSPQTDFRNKKIFLVSNAFLTLTIFTKNQNDVFLSSKNLFVGTYIAIKQRLM